MRVCEWCHKCKHVLFVTLKFCFVKHYQLDIITKYRKWISAILKIIILALFSPFNMSYHESPLIFLNVSIKPESVKSLITAAEVKFSPLCSYREWGYSLVPVLGLSEYESLHICPWHCFHSSSICFTEN